MTTPAGDSDARAGTRIYSQVLELEQQLKRARGPDLRTLRSRLREKYVELILTDFEVSEEHQVANTLWHSAFYAPCTELRNRVATYGGENQQVSLLKLRKFLAEGIQFYLSLIRKLKRKYGMDNDLKGQSLARDSKRMLEYQKMCHKLYIHLGDLARYKEQYPEGTPDFKVPAGYYYRAISLWPSAGHPHNQLAVLATYMHNEFVAVYQYCRGLAALEPVDTATANLSLVFQKNLQHSDDSQKSKTTPGKPNKDVDGSEEKTFFGSLVRLLAILHLKKSLEKFPDIYMETISSLEKLPSFDLERLFTRDLQNAAIPATGLALVTVQITSMIICSVNGSSTTDNTYANALQYSSTVSKYALAAAFKIAACLLSTCAESKDPPMLAGSLVFMEWLARRQDLLTGAGTDDDERLSNAKASFWKESVTVFNNFNTGTTNQGPLKALWEDRELQGFKPLAAAHESLDFSSHYGSYEEENQARVWRFIASGKIVASVMEGTGKGFIYDQQANMFFLAGERKEWKQLEKSTEKQLEIKPSESQVTSSLLLPPVAASLSPEQDEEEEVIVFRPAVKATPLEKPERLPTPPQLPASTAVTTTDTSMTNSLEPVRSFGLLPQLMNGTTFPSVTSSFDAFQSRYGGYGYGNGLASEPSAAVFPPAPAQSDPSSLYQDLLFQLQASSLRDSREAAFARQAPINHGLGGLPANDFVKQVDAIKEEPAVVRASVRPPPGFGPIPARNKLANQTMTPPRAAVDPTTNARFLENSNWESYNPSKLSGPRPLFSTDFGGIWSNGNSSSNSYQAPISSAATSYPFPGMGARTMQQQHVIEQPSAPLLQPAQSSLLLLQQQQQQYGGWLPEPAVLGFDNQRPPPAVQHLQQNQDIEQQVLRQYRPPDPFVS